MHSWGLSSAPLSITFSFSLSFSLPPSLSPHSPYLPPVCESLPSHHSPSRPDGIKCGRATRNDFQLRPLCWGHAFNRDSHLFRDSNWSPKASGVMWKTCIHEYVTPAQGACWCPVLQWLWNMHQNSSTTNTTAKSWNTHSLISNSLAESTLILYVECSVSCWGGAPYLHMNAPRHQMSAPRHGLAAFLKSVENCKANLPG